MVGGEGYQTRKNHRGPSETIRHKLKVLPVFLDYTELLSLWLLLVSHPCPAPCGPHSSHAHGKDLPDTPYVSNTCLVSALCIGRSLFGENSLFPLSLSLG